MGSTQTGSVRSTREWVEELLETLEPIASRLGAEVSFARVRAMLERNGAMAQREVAADRGLLGLCRWLAERFLEAPSG